MGEVVQPPLVTRTFFTENVSTSAMKEDLDQCVKLVTIFSLRLSTLLFSKLICFANEKRLKATGVINAHVFIR